MSDPAHLEHEVNKYALYFVYLGIASFVAAFCQVAFWTLTGESERASAAAAAAPRICEPSPIPQPPSRISNLLPPWLSHAVPCRAAPRCAPAGVRQVNRMRHRYLAAVLRQDVGYYDTTATSGRLLQGLNEDCQTIQAAIGDKVGMTLFNLATAVVGIIIGAGGGRVGGRPAGQAVLRVVGGQATC